MKRKRKERSDKGVPKGPRKKVGAQEAGDDGGEEDEPEAGPSKRRKVDTQKKGPGKGKGLTKKATAAKVKAQLPPSNEYLSDTDLEDL